MLFFKACPVLNFLILAKFQYKAGKHLTHQAECYVKKTGGSLTSFANFYFLEGIELVSSCFKVTLQKRHLNQKSLELALQLIYFISYYELFLKRNMTEPVFLSGRDVLLCHFRTEYSMRAWMKPYFLREAESKIFLSPWRIWLVETSFRMLVLQ